jgi:hypothetical protein
VEFREGDSFTYAVYDEPGCYDKLYDGLRHWVTEVFPFRQPYYSNAEIPGVRNA